VTLVPLSCAPLNVVVTTSREPTEALQAEAERWGALLGVPVVERSGSLARVCREHEVRGVLVVTGERVVYHEPENELEYFYHPGMTRVRFHNLKIGRRDPMLKAMDLQAGDSVLDCTLGRASDAALCQLVVGLEGRVVGLEVSPILAHLTREGLQHYVDPNRELTAALRRIEALCADYHEYLPHCATNEFTVVYFDPIFHEPVEESSAMPGLRALADDAPVTAATVAEALRVARRCVVIKQRKGTPLWGELGVTETVGSPAGRVEYGIISTS
jgi:16S rRNA (guanine1516-N2)-methyltransferase